MWVLAYHTMLALQPLDLPLTRIVCAVGRAGYLGVDLFFVLSGFIIAYRHAATPQWTRTEYGAFLWRRLARIYPVHLLGLAIFVIYVLQLPSGKQSDPHTALGLIGSIALVHAWSIPVVGTWNIPSWSVSLEWAAYLMFPAIATLAMRLKSTVVLVGLVLLLFLGLFLAVMTFSFAGTMSYGAFRIAAEFTAGVLLFRFWSLRQDSIPAIWGIAALAALILTANSLECLIGRKAALVHLPILAVPVVYCLACAPSALAGSVPLLLGRISYSLYMVHFVTLRFVSAAVTSYGLQPAWILVGAVAAIGIAQLSYTVLEVPARRWMLKLAAQRSSLSAVASRSRLE